MKYVLDSSVAFKWVVLEPFSDKAQRLRDEFRNNANELIAPDIFAVEVAHALTRAERQGRVSVLQGAAFLADVLSTPPHFLPSLPLLSRAYTLSSSARIGVYDCLYVALAEQEQCEFITADDRLFRSLQAQFSFIRLLASLP